VKENINSIKVKEQPGKELPAVLFVKCNPSPKII